MERSTYTPPTRLARLDGLRGVAACVVAAYHLQIFYYNGLSDFYGGVAGWFFRWGWTFVDLFFVISGYIFAHVYSGGTALRNGRQLGDFAVARIARLYPLHLTMLLIVAVLDWGRPENTIPIFLCHLFMLQGLVPGADAGFVGPSWSISVEMLCYFLFALAASSGKRTLTWVSFALVALIVTKLALLGLSGGPWGADYLIGGVLGFFIGQLMWQCRDLLERVPAIVLALTFAIGAMADVGSYSPLLPLDLLAWPSALLLVLRIKAFEARPLLWLGERSYGIYLIHYPVLSIFFRILGKSHASSMGVITLYLTFAIVVLALSDVALRLIERPGRRAVREAWIKHRPAPRMAAPSRLTEVD
ncbi:MAG: acyltransferase [Devosia sp.]|jgi:peptidoglycan/LPS O-acetylase OafA/YrhL|uniref:acyltransferase family protein n=1 Tax=Devosia sp. TaxID=1871048 RepID=UPI002629EFB9|nr:acyltransferase [Devosia sp.]MDB5541296.1 acyltransferase [Devosia sp.]